MDTMVHGSGAMFDKIARRYDLLNSLMSFGMDRMWRRALVKALQCPDKGQVLDVATGTADVALAICAKHRHVRVTGLDPSVGMLDVGRAKITNAGLLQRIKLEVGDAQALPFAEDAFDAACVSFGIRNVPDRLQGLREMTRVVAPGGRVVVLELGEPDKGPLGVLARLYIHRIVPKLGAMLSGRDEYDYLQASIAAFPRPAVFADLMAQAGLRDVTHRPLSFGAVNLFWGTK